MRNERLRIGTRGSALALWQARWVSTTLSRAHRGLDVSIEVVKTTGDRDLTSPLSAIGDKGLFTRDIESALLAGTIDAAVHSLKDLPTELPAGLGIGAIPKREDARDVFIPHPGNPRKTFQEQLPGARIATGSLRRKCQILSIRSDVEIVDIRGNLDTRLKKLETSDWAGMILARAGVVRLGLERWIGETLEEELLLPAIGQGALAIEVRTDDRHTARVIAVLEHGATRQAVTAERALLRTLEGGCQVPIGAFGRIESRGGPQLFLDAMVGSLNGRTIVRGKTHGDPPDAESIGRSLGETLLAGGAAQILRDIRATGDTHEVARVEV